LRRAGRAAEADEKEAILASDAPGHLGLLVLREQAALKAADWERLTALYLAEAEVAASERSPSGAPDPIWAATATTQAALCLSEHLGRDVEGVAALGLALRHAPGFRPA